MVAFIFLVSCATLVIAYRTYGRYIERKLLINRNSPTPAISKTDGVDYVPANNLVLFGHHFSSIAGAGPIVGPIFAGLAFGWIPALLWIVIGAILVGGVHDYTSLMASIRHQGRTIGQVCKDYLSPITYKLFLVFIWFALVYVIIVFLDLTATTFSPPSSVSSSPEQSAVIAARGGHVATSSLLYIIIALAFGFSLNKLKFPFKIATCIFVPLVFAGLWIGSLLPLTKDVVPAFLGNSKHTWSLVLLAYCFVASITPVWVLLQPRDFLSSFLLFACLAGGAIGILLGGITGSLPVQYEGFRAFVDINYNLGPLFPALFITIACGAVSGFHSIVASGTTSKQLKNEQSAKPIAYGAMLVEAGLAVVALSTVMILSEDPGKTPIDVFASGIGKFFSTFGFPSEMATTFGLLSISTFLLTTLDTCTRLARFVFQELFKLRRTGSRLVATMASLVIPSILVFTAIPGPQGTLIPAWKAIWPIFGASNQLLAALALLVVYAWLRHEGKKALFVLIPMSFMAITTFCAMGIMVYNNLLKNDGSILVGIISLSLWILAIVVIIDTFLHLRKPRSPKLPLYENT